MEGATADAIFIFFKLSETPAVLRASEVFMMQDLAETKRRVRILH
jgi:hypothetical protein